MTPKPTAKRVFEATLTGLTNGLTHLVEARAVNVAGAGATTRADIVIPGPSRVPPPRDLVVKAHSSGTGILYGFLAPETPPRHATYLAELRGSTGLVRTSQMTRPPRRGRATALMTAPAGAYRLRVATKHGGVLSGRGR